MICQLTKRKRSYLIQLIPIFLIISVLSCHAPRAGMHSNLSNEMLYAQSIEQAMTPSPEKICTELISISPENKELIWKKIGENDYLLVVTWKQNTSYYQPYLDSGFFNTENYPMWVTIAPELWKRIRKENPKDTELRLKQLLGLPPEGVYSSFVEFWVKPEDLFRPCPDREINDHECELCFTDANDSTHMDWINSNRISRYYGSCNVDEKYPWTQLGYTYDWNPENHSHVGLSEFVIRTKSDILVEAIYTTKEYLDMELLAY